jgi:hypothetical protein
MPRRHQRQQLWLVLYGVRDDSEWDVDVHHRDVRNHVQQRVSTLWKCLRGVQHSSQCCANLRWKQL